MTGAHGPKPFTGSTVAVVGGGWSGIAAAWYLAGGGAEVTLFDEQDRLGGRCAGTELGSRTVTLGGKNIGRNYTYFRDFARTLGSVAFEPFGINSSRVEDGRLRTIDSSARLRSATVLARSTSPRDGIRLLRLASLVRRHEAEGHLGGPALTALALRHSDPPLHEYFGPRACAALLRPLTVRTTGAEPDEVHLGTLGCQLGLLMDSFDQPTAGFDPLFRAFAQRVTVRLGTRVTRLARAGDRVVGVLAAPTSTKTPTLHPADTVVVALPAPSAARLVEEAAGELAAELRQIRYFPAAVIVAEYERPVFPERVRSLVFGPEEPLSNAGAYGLAERNIVRYTFSGRAARRRLAADVPDADLLDLAEDLLGAHFPVRRQDRRDFVAGRWVWAYCAYSRFHERRLRRLAGLGAAVPGLEITGDYVRGASIEQCFRAARARVSALAARWSG
nr:FAD-dependent oxidoreductase [Streptomyces cupreus]